MKPQNYVVSLTVGGATRSRTWNTENELAIGHPIRWVLERSGSGLHIRNVVSGAVTEVTERELASGDFIDLPEKGSKSGFSLRLRALETLPAAYKTHEGEGELRVYTVRGAWTSAAETVEGKYVGRADGHRVFTLTRENDQFWIRAHEEGLELAPSRGPAQSIPQGEEVLFKAKAIAGRSLIFGETTWRLDTLAPVAAPEMVEGLEVEDASFQRTLRAALAAVAALFLVSLILPKSDEVPIQETKIVFKRLVHGTMTAAPKGTGDKPDPAAMGPQSEVGPKSDAAPKKASSDMGPKAVKEMGPKPDPKRKAEPHRMKIETAKAPSKPKAVAKKPEPAPKFKELRKSLAKSIAKIVSKTESKPVVTKSATAQSKPVPKALAKAAPKVIAKPQPVKKTDLSQTAVGRLLKASSLQSAARSIEHGGVSGVRTSGSRDALPGGSSSLDETAGVARGASVGARSVEVSSLGGAAGISGNEGEKNVGYGKGAHASVNGQGRSFVSLDPSGSDVAEGLTKDQVGAVIHRHMSEIRYCYEAAMIRSPDVEGKLAVKFVIGGAGSVKTAGVAQSSLGDPKLDDCVMQRLTRWKFPNPRGGVDVAVNYPFVFKTLGR